MASYAKLSPSFAKDTPVLRLNRGKVPDARWVLWPVYVWRVVVPVPQDRKLNLFQRAVLGLARAGVTRLVDVGDRLLIAADLAGVVFLELQNMGLLDYSGALTVRGMKLLDDIEEDPPDESRVGHVLSDPWTGKLWPRFLSGDLPIADVEFNEDGWPVLLSGSAGDPWRDRTFSVLPGAQDTVVMSRPNARDVLHAARRHRRQREFEAVEDERDLSRIERVSFIDDRPRPFLFALRVRRHDSGDWMVDDPFGHGEAVDLRARLEKHLDSDDGLHRWIAPLVDEDQSTPSLQQLQNKATWEVERRLTLGIRQHAAVHDRLVAMQRALLEASGEDALPDKWDDVLLKSQRAVERTLRMVYEPYRDSGGQLFAKLAQSDRDFNRRLLDAIAGELGFQVPLPATLSFVRRGKVQHAEQSGSGSLRPLLILTLLCADIDADHPLRHASQRGPDLLRRLDELATARDRAAHDGSDTRPQTVTRHVETTFAVVEVLLLSR